MGGQQSEIGTNITASVSGNILTLTIDLAQTFGPSASGKSITVASTGGNKECPGHPDIRVGVNVYKAAKK
jgi:hypothetical protein